MTVLVTGAAGFVGGHVTDLLLSLGERPRMLVHPDDNAERLELAGVEIYRGDIADRAALQPAVDRRSHPDLSRHSYGRLGAPVGLAG